MLMLVIPNNKPELSVSVEKPKNCPYCRCKIDPKHVFSHYSGSRMHGSELITAFFECPSCSHAFASEYVIFKGNQPVGFHQRDLPPVQFSPNIDERVCEISPRFYDLFYQSGTAAVHGLTDLAGMGFRKALECLVKDSLIFLGRSEEDVVKLSLNDAISLFNDCPVLSNSAHLIRSVGNDFAHYHNKYEPYSVKTLETLISNVCSVMSLYLDLHNNQPLPN